MNILAVSATKTLKRYSLVSQFYLESLHPQFQLVKEHPILWFKEDDFGGWVRTMNLLSINNMILKDGSGVPSKASAVQGTVLEMIKACVLAGADPNIANTLSKPFSFSDMVTVLEGKGLVSPTIVPPTSRQSGPGQPEIDQLGKSYSSEVL